jgi:hypothetical protein
MNFIVVGITSFAARFEACFGSFQFVAQARDLV